MLTSLICMHVRKRIALLILSMLFSSVRSVAQDKPTENSSGGAAGLAAPGFRMIRATAGTKGIEQHGRFFISDPRTVFHLSDDHKVIVEFEWDGPVGPHKFQGLWKDPGGKVAIVSDFQFEPKATPFAGYFTMLIDEGATTGIWTIDSRIDGQTSGSYSFEIVAGAGTSPVPTARIPLNATDIYHEAQAATAFVEKFDSDGKESGRGTGFSPFRVTKVSAPLRYDDYERGSSSWDLRFIAFARHGSKLLIGVRAQEPFEIHTPICQPKPSCLVHRD
jgi:hypothetical protein